MYSQTLQLKKRKIWDFSQKCPSGKKLIGKCQNGHVWVQDTTCKKEDCPVCGREGSVAHYRRYVRNIPKIIEMYEEGKGVGYLVITWNKNELDLKNISKKTFGKIRRYVIRMLKRELGNIRGIARWHWAGDLSQDFYPHLNILFNYGKIEKEKLQRIKDLIYEKLKVKVVHYSYTKKVGKMLHWLRYIERPTFLLQNQISYSFLKGFKNNVVFGRWKKEYEKMGILEWVRKVEKLFEKGYFDLYMNEDYIYIYHLVRSRCPYCFEKIKWKLADGINVVILKERSIKGGFYEILDYVGTI